VECALLLVLILPLPVLWLVAHAILYPTVVAAQAVQGPFRFQLLDFVALLLQIQLVLGAIMGFVPDDQFRAQRGILITFGMGATIALWLGSVRFLSKAGITRGMHRMIFILLYLPGTLAVIIVGPLAVIAIVFVFVEWGREWNFSAPLAVTVAVVAVTVAAGFALRRLGQWLVDQQPSSKAYTSSSSS
jgi:hypothetical protein